MPEISRQNDRIEIEKYARRDDFIFRTENKERYEICQLFPGLSKRKNDKDIAEK